MHVKSYDHCNFSTASVVEFWASQYIMPLNRTSVWKVLTIWIFREVPLFNFQCLDILWPRIGHPCETLWPFEFLESLRCSISSVLIYYAPKSHIRVKGYDHLNLPRASDIQFCASRYIMSPNRTSIWKVMTIWISRKLLDNFRCWISSVSIYYVPDSFIRVKRYDHLNFSIGSVVQFWASQYIMCLNRTSVWKVMTIWISREVPVFSFQCLDILCLQTVHPFEKIGPFEFLEMFRCSISSVWIYYAPESYIRVKSYATWISRRVPLFNFERRDILCAQMGHPCKTLWPFEFLESFPC